MTKNIGKYDPGFRSVAEYVPPEVDENDGIPTTELELGGNEQESAAEDIHGDLWDGLVVGKRRRRGKETKAVFGDDDRVAVPRIADSPFSGICQLEITTPDGGGPFVGTGWLISPTVLITAGHCVYCDPWESDGKTFGSGRAKAIKAFFGRAGQQWSDAVDAVGIEFPAEWQRDQQNRAFDFAAVRLARPVSSAFAPLVFGDASDDLLQNMRVCIAGYPAGSKFNKTMHMHSGKIMSSEAQELHYQIDTTPGNSGCPLIYYNSDSLTNVVVGIHNSGSKNVHNTAARINSLVFAKLSEWQKKGG